VERLAMTSLPKYKQGGSKKIEKSEKIPLFCLDMITNHIFIE